MLFRATEDSRKAPCFCPATMRGEAAAGLSGGSTSQGVQTQADVEHVKTPVHAWHPSLMHTAAGQTPPALRSHLMHKAGRSPRSAPCSACFHHAHASVACAHACTRSVAVLALVWAAVLDLPAISKATAGGCAATEIAPAIPAAKAVVEAAWAGAAAAAGACAIAAAARAAAAAAAAGAAVRGRLHVSALPVAVRALPVARPARAKRRAPQ